MAYIFFFLWLVFAAAIFHLTQPYIILAPTRAIQLLLGMVFSSGTRMAAKALFLSSTLK